MVTFYADGQSNVTGCEVTCKEAWALRQSTCLLDSGFHICFGKLPSIRNDPRCNVICPCLISTSPSRHAVPQGVSSVLKSLLIHNATVGCVWKYSAWLGNRSFSRTSRSGDECHWEESLSYLSAACGNTRDGEEAGGQGDVCVGHSFVVVSVGRNG